MTIKMFDNMDEMVKFESEAQQKALAATKQWQRDLTYGDHFVVYEPSAELVVFCRVWTRDEIFPPLEDMSRASRADRASEIEMYDENYKMGFRLCDNSSPWNVEGEPGDCHVLKAVMKITPEQYDLAKQVNWSMGRIEQLDSNFFDAIMRSILNER